MPDVAGVENISVDALHGVLKYKRRGKDGKVAGLISTLVDDLLVGGTPEFDQEVIVPLKRRFVMGDEESADLIEYVGLDLRQRRGKDGKLSVTLGQKGYVEKMRGIELTNERKRQVQLR